MTDLEKITSKLNSLGGITTMEKLLEFLDVEDRKMEVIYWFMLYEFERGRMDGFRIGMHHGVKSSVKINNN